MRAFDEDRGGAVGEPVGVFGHAVQLLAFAEQHGVAGVEVLRALPWLDVVVGVGVVGGGVASADEADDLVVVVDGQDEAVAEGVDEPAGGGVLGEPGGEQFLIGGAVAAQVGGEGGPAGVGRSRAWMRGSPVRSVPASRSRQVGLGPRAAVGVLVEGGGLLVEVGDPLRADGGELGFGCSSEGPFELLVAGFPGRHPVRGPGRPGTVPRRVRLRAGRVGRRERCPRRGRQRLDGCRCRRGCSRGGCRAG